MVEILKHLGGDWVIEPRPSTAGEQRDKWLRGLRHKPRLVH
jgi:hypothetical protein